ncbi:DHH family phosphoesterase [Halalkalirubrum salinum]|uniref:DHH family phosphoesterase n=1 Tax=Halalkalirubrum salinum TaxID=2563889 RepID=UPI0010FB58A7|nr:phosphohydrolase [Halalkalirubrum salinum]
MDDEFFDTNRLSLRRRSLIPGAGFFYPDSLDDERAEAQAKDAIEGTEAVVVTDSDADGLGCVALIREAYDAALDVDPYLAAVEARLAEDTDSDDEAVPAVDDGNTSNEEPTETEPTGDESPVALLAASPHSLDTALERVAAYAEPGIDLFVCDLCPDSYDRIAEPLETLSERCDRIAWYDHHQWGDNVEAAVRDAGVELVIGESDEECSTDVALRSIDYDFPARFEELATVTRDHDLWLNEDERSADLADYAYWSGAEEYAAIVGAYGASLPDPVVDYIAHRRVEKERLIEAAVDRAEHVDVGPWTVGVTYGRCSQNEVADALREAGTDAAVIVKPSGSASIRGSDGFEQSHLVARQVNGGGHPKAAGCKPDIYDDMLDYAHHWTTEGAAAKRVILAAFDRVADGSVAEE